MTKNDITFKTVFSYKEVNTSEWNSLVLGKLYLELDYLKSLENSVSEISNFVYTIYYKEEQAIGISVFQKLVLDFEKYDYSTIPCKFKTHLIKKFLTKNTDILICGNIFATGEYMYSFNENVLNTDLFASINNNINEILKKDRKIKYVIFKEFWEENKSAEILSLQYDYHKFNIDVNMVAKMEGKATDLKAYIAHFKAKYRTRANKVLNNSSDLKIVEFDTFQIKTNAKRIESLYQAVLKKSNFNLGVFNFETFFRLKQNLGKRYRFYTYYYEGKIVGFKTFFHFNGNVDASFIGIDYSLNTQLNIYQRMLLDYIAFSLENNTKMLVLGRTAETIKCCIGAEPNTMNLYVKHRNVIGNTILKKVIEYVKPTEFSIRRPFKKEYYQ